MFGIIQASLLQSGTLQRMVSTSLLPVPALMLHGQQAAGAHLQRLRHLRECESVPNLTTPEIYSKWSVRMSKGDGGLFVVLWYCFREEFILVACETVLDRSATGLNILQPVTLAGYMSARRFLHMHRFLAVTWQIHFCLPNFPMRV
jgi:hypothetical protein